jgi:ribosomal protein S27AE
VSDLSKCLFEVWARRNDEPQVVRGPKSLATLQAGLRDEDWIVDRIERGLPKGEAWQIYRSGVLAADSDLSGHLDVEMARARCPRCSDWLLMGKTSHRWYCSNYCDPGFMDFDQPPAEHALFDVKTTEWKEDWYETGSYYDSGKPVKARRRIPWPDSPKLSHRLQAFGYVQRRPKNPDGKHMPFAIVEWCRSSFGMKVDWFDGDDPALLELHEQRTRDVIYHTKPGSDPVQEGIAVVTASGAMAGFPREKWQCGYCTNAMCALNVTKDNEVIPA